MSDTVLPPLSKLIFPAYLTFLRGIKISDDDIKISQEFSNVTIDVDNLEAYKEYFNFKSQLPVTYIYIVAQRALLHLMLHKEFTIAVPGIVHISNEVQLTAQFNIDEKIEIKASIHVPVKEGSLFPKAEIIFYQKGVEVARNISNYIAKRKSPKKSSKRKENVSTFGLDSFREEWVIEKSIGKSYAQLSQDKNPIHTSKLFAKMIGFKRPIAHGWYSVNRVVSVAEKENNCTFKSIRVAFNKPIYLPSKVQFQLNDGNQFKVTNPYKAYTYLEGDLS